MPFTTKWVDIFYKCGCMQKEVALQIAERRPDEDVLDFMERMQVLIGNDHKARSPGCESQVMEYAKIHVPNDANHIGEAGGGTA